ncbi:MAG TPA: hypothetical protein VMV16_10210 [Solirubrobacteraceae bacterium]|nr:hypothetical protein [Solirubrobacteraceae bacterium]
MRNRSTSSEQLPRGRWLQTTMLVCPIHGETEFVLRSDGGTRCKRCRAAAVIRRRQRVKQILVEEAGGRCVICGYDRYVGGLAFHHLDRATKVTGLAQRGRALAIATLREEAKKCVLLCHNCHAEVEAGLAAVPIHLAQRTAESTG